MQSTRTLKSVNYIVNVRYHAIILVIYQKEKVNYMSNKNALTFMKVEDEIEVDWAQIIFNNLCNELDRWTKMQEKM
jgi:hypothetical protein